MNKEIVPKNGKNNVLAAAAAGATSSVVVLIFTALLVHHLTKFEFLSNQTCIEFAKANFCLFDDQWDSETYLATISSFYGTIITLLVAFLTFVAAFAFFAIRASSLSHMDDMVHEKVELYFEDSRTGDQRIKDVLKDLDQDKYIKIGNRVDDIENALQEHGILPPTQLDVDK